MHLGSLISVYYNFIQSFYILQAFDNLKDYTQTKKVGVNEKKNKDRPFIKII